MPGRLTTLQHKSKGAQSMKAAVLAVSNALSSAALHPPATSGGHAAHQSDNTIVKIERTP